MCFTLSPIFNAVHELLIFLNYLNAAALADIYLEEEKKKRERKDYNLEEESTSTSVLRTSGLR